MSLYLITTADERFWRFDRPALFLGEWCCLYDRKYIWSNMDAIVAKPFGLGVKQRIDNLNYIQSLSNQLLHELSDALNIYHKTNHSLRYWNIIIGYWLNKYVEVAFNRYFTFKQAIDKYDISGVTIVKNKDYSLATKNSLDFIFATSDISWNQVLDSKILNYFDCSNLTIDLINTDDTGFFYSNENLKLGWKNKLKKIILNTGRRFLNQFSRKKDAFIINSFMPLKHEVELQLSLGQCPQLWVSPEVKYTSVKIQKRNNIKIYSESYSGFEKFIRDLLPEVIPICFIESYEENIQQVNDLPWPEKPRFIFTSNNFGTDEIFKMWTASKVEKGYPYYIGQHGNNYGTLIGSPNWTEFVTCDKFLTWGRSDNKSCVPAFNFKLLGKKYHDYNPDGGLLLIELHLPHRHTPEDGFFEFGVYQEEQFNFVKSLPGAIQKELTVRLHGSCQSTCWHENLRWKDSSPDTKIEMGVTSLRKMIAQSRLVVHSYDSTGILETLALNIPTIAFWQNGFNHLLPSAKPYYSLLRDVGIIADNYQEAAKFIAKNWDNISEWWESEKVQSARINFCEQFSKTEKKPIRTIKRLLKM